MSVILELPEELASRLRTLAAERGQELDGYALSALTDLVNRAAAGRAEGQRLLHGPSHRFDPDAIRKKWGLPDLSGLTPEERAERAEAALDRVSSEQRVEAERQGLI